jgi:outer membrane protein TolC
MFHGLEASSCTMQRALAVLLTTSASAAYAESLSIEEAIRLGLAQNERAAIAEQRVEASKARVQKARAFFFPDLTAHAAYTRRGAANTVTQTANALSASAGTTLTLFDARSFPLYRRATLEREAEQFFASDDKRLLAFEVADAFLSTLSLGELEGAAKIRLEFAEQSLRDARARFEADLVSSNDVTRPELERATAERELVRARAEVARAKVLLGYLIGRTVDELEKPRMLDTAESSTVADRAELITRAAESRLDLRGQEKLVEASDALALEPKLRWIPSLGLSGEVRWTNEPELQGGRDVDGSLSVNLSWILFDGGERYADARELESLAEIAKLELQASGRRVTSEIDQALIALEAGRGAKRQATLAASAAKRNAEEISELYRQGLARALEVADANAQLFQANVGLAREQYGLLVAYLDLFTALGLDPTGKEWTER